MSNVKQKYTFAVIATDVAIFTIHNDSLHVLLIHMKKKPFTGMWALPGGLIRPHESVDDGAKRHLSLKTGVKNVYLEQLYTFGEVHRDPFGRVVSVAYMALIPSQNIKLKTTKEYAEVKWFLIRKLPKLAYDHSEVITYALSRIRAKLEYTNVAYSLLPKEFTLSDLQRIYEIILNKKIDKRNFRKKILSLNLIKRLRKKTSGSTGRPAQFYQFRTRAPQIVDIIS